MTVAIMSDTPQGQHEVSQVGHHIPLCRRVAHPWHAIRGTEAMRLRFIEAVRGLRQHAACPQAADAVIEAPYRIAQRVGRVGEGYRPKAVTGDI